MFPPTLLPILLHLSHPCRLRDPLAVQSGSHKGSRTAGLTSHPETITRGDSLCYHQESRLQQQTRPDGAPPTSWQEGVRLGLEIFLSLRVHNQTISCLSASYHQ